MTSRGRFLKQPKLFRIYIDLRLESSSDLAPSWKSESLRATVKEGQLPEEILRLEVEEDDCGQVEVCHYQIESERQQPFEINKDGKRVCKRNVGDPTGWAEKRPLCFMQLKIF